MLDIQQIKQYIIKPALETIRMASPGAIELVLGTWLQESQLTYIRQIGGGPALGLGQMEPATHDDAYINFIGYRPHLRDLLKTIEPTLKSDALLWNLRYAAAMTRIQYARAPEPIPEVGDFAGCAKLWKLRYNTPRGAGTEAEYIDKWRKYVLQAA